MLWHLPRAGQVRGRRMESIKQGSRRVFGFGPSTSISLVTWDKTTSTPLSACDNWSSLVVEDDGIPCPTSRSIKGIISDSLRHTGVHQLHSQLDPGLKAKFLPTKISPHLLMGWLGER